MHLILLVSSLSGFGDDLPSFRLPSGSCGFLELAFCFIGVGRCQSRTPGVEGILGVECYSRSGEVAGSHSRSVVSLNCICETGHLIVP